MSNNVSEFGKENGLIHEAVVTGRSVGAGQDFWSRLAHDKNFFAQLVAVASGESRIEHTNHMIDTEICDSPGGEFNTKPKQHISHGKLIWDPTRIKLVPSTINPLGVPVNATVMYALEDKPFLIPREWIDKRIFFKGTLFTKGSGSDWVRSMEVRDDGRNGVRTSISISGNVPSPCSEPDHFDAILI